MRVNGRSNHYHPRRGASFAICDDRGDIGYHGVDGLFVADTRICSRLVLSVHDQTVEPLTADQGQRWRLGRARL